MFILGLSDDEFNDAIRNNDKATLANHLYRVQKLTTKEYCFRLHIETSVDDKYNGVKNMMLSKNLGKLVMIQSLSRYNELSPRRIKTTILGELEI